MTRRTHREPKTASTAGATLECDYDKDITHLYRLIQSQDWQGVKYQSENFPKEAKTYVYRKDETGSLKWRVLPIHAAILMEAPLSALESLLKAYPEACEGQDDRGALPIHLAIKKHVPPEVINLLLAAFPDAIDVKNQQGLTPYDMAKTTSSTHKSYYLKALKRGATHSAVTASFSDLLCGVSMPKVSDFRIPNMPNMPNVSSNIGDLKRVMGMAS